MVVYIPSDCWLNILRIHSPPNTKHSLEWLQHCSSLKAALLLVSPVQSPLWRQSWKESLFLLYKSWTEPPEKVNDLQRILQQASGTAGGRGEPQLMSWCLPNAGPHCLQEHPGVRHCFHSCLFHTQRWLLTWNCHQKHVHMHRRSQKQGLG